MNEEKFNKKIEDRWGGHEERRGHGRQWTGLLLLIIGGSLLLKTANLVIFPGWFFTWPVLLIAIGLFTAVRHGFRGPLWFILILIGSLSLANHIDPSMHLDRFMWPIIFIIMGMMFILRPKKSRWRRWRQYHYHGSMGQEDPLDPHNTPGGATQTMNTERGDFLDVTSVFGGVKKNVLSKNFKGGDIVSFMGGSEIDLTQADFTGTVTIDATNIFGGTKLIVPSSWDVHNDITAVFGGVDDKRQVHGITMDPTKVLILDGTCLFGGIEIKSY